MDGGGCFRKWVSDPDGRASGESTIYQLIESVNDGARITDRVQKGIATAGAHIDAASGLIGAGTVGGHAVDEEEALAFDGLQGGEDRRVGRGEPRSHMVVHADGMRYALNIGRHDIYDLVPAVTDVHRPGSGRELWVEWFHRLVQQQFAALVVNFMGQLIGVGEVGKHGEGQVGGYF